MLRIETGEMTRGSMALRLAEAIEATRGVAIPAGTARAVEHVLLDSFACAVGAAGSPAVQASLRWAARLSGSPAASIYFSLERSSVLGASLVNSTMIRDLDLNDTYFGINPTHPSDSLGGVLAVAEAEGASAEETMRAILVSFEIQIRAADFTETSYFRTLGWDHTTFITIATAAAAGGLLRLSPEELAHAIAIAACFPVLGGLRAGQISMMKSLSAGLTASRGVEAAYLAKEGAKGPLQILEGERGLEKLVLQSCDWDLFTEPVGEWRLLRTCLKRYPAAYIIHSSIDAAIALRRAHGFRPHDVQEVVVEGFEWLLQDMVHGMGGTSRFEIDGRETADHSLPYCVAAALVDGEYTVTQLRQRRWEAPEIQQMLARIRCEHDPSMDARFPAERPSRVTVVLAGGERLTEERAYPKGDYRKPLSPDDLVTKLGSLAGTALDPEAQERLAACCLDFRNRGVGELMKACAA